MVPDKSFVVGSWWEYSKTAFSISYLIIGRTYSMLTIKNKAILFNYNTSTTTEKLLDNAIDNVIFRNGCSFNELFLDARNGRNQGICQDLKCLNCYFQNRQML